MRYGVISDVHGNLQALRDVVAKVRRLGVDGWICAGDVVGYGPRPNECVELVTGLEALIVAGNHELIATGVLSRRSTSALAQRSHAWTRSVLREDVLVELRRWPRRLEQDGIVVAHGSLDDPEHYTSTVDRCAVQLRQLGRESSNATVLVLGHTHKQRLYVEELGLLQRWERGSATRLPAGRRCVVNPGSVGQSRDWEWPPRARAALLDMEEGLAVPVRIVYDVWKSLDDARRHRLPYRTIHSPPRLRYTIASRARAAVSTLSHGRMGD